MSVEVAFDLRRAEGRPTGVGRHLLSVVQAVAEHAPEIQLRAYTRSGDVGLPKGVRVVPVAHRGVRWHTAVWRDLTRSPVDAYCSTSLLIPAFTTLPALPIVLDIISFLFPGYVGRRTLLAERLLMKRALRHRTVIAGSETTRADLGRVFGTVSAVVVPPWVPAPHASAPWIETDASPYALFVGTVEPRKNVETAIAAVEALRADGVPLRLVIVGGRGWAPATTYNLIAAAERRGSVRWAGYVSDEQRDALYAGAACVLVPSHYEGFGLPLLEALARGVPCVGSDIPAFREVAQDGAILVSPRIAADWADAIRRLIAPGSAETAKLVESGRRSAARYSPAGTARAFCEAVERVRL